MIRTGDSGQAASAPLPTLRPPVVPAKAGTHNHRHQIVGKAVAPAGHVHTHTHSWLWVPAFAGTTRNLLLVRPGNRLRRTLGRGLHAGRRLALRALGRRAAARTRRDRPGRALRLHLAVVLELGLAGGV